MIITAVPRPDVTTPTPPPSEPPAVDPTVFTPRPLPLPETVFGLTTGQILTALAVTLVPAVLVLAGLTGVAAARAWEPRRLRTIAGLALTAAAAAALTTGIGWAAPPWAGLAFAVRAAWTGLDTGSPTAWAAAVAVSTVSTAPPAAVAAWWWWHSYCTSMRSGRRHAAGERHVRRQWDIRRTTAATRARRDPTPLTTSIDGGPAVVLGPAIDTVTPHPPKLTDALTARRKPWLTVPLSAIALHIALIAQTGAGKTVLLIRLAAAWWEAAWHAHAEPPTQAADDRRSRRATRPLVIFLDAKGEPDTTAPTGTGGRWTTALTALGVDPTRIGMFPDETRLNMWRLPAPQLRASLHKLASTDHRFYDVLQRGLLHLVIDAPKLGGPPADSTAFLNRLAATDRLATAWAGHTAETRMVAALTGSNSAGHSAGHSGSGGAAPLDADLILFAELFRSLGGDFDGGQPLSDFDALYACVPGTLDPVTAAAKAAVLIELLTYELITEPRTVLFVIDEYSAISGDTAGTVINLVERLRSLGGAVIVSAQSYQGLADTDDDRERLLGAMGGGMLIGRTQNADPLAARFGTRQIDETGLHIAGDPGDPGQGGAGLFTGGHTGAGTVRRQHTFLLDPNRIRTLPPHHVAYATPDEIVYGLVTPLHTTT